MNRSAKFGLAAGLTVSLIIVVVTFQQTERLEIDVQPVLNQTKQLFNRMTGAEKGEQGEGEVMQLILVLCGGDSQMIMSKALLRSAVLTSKRKMHFHIVSDNEALFYPSLVVMVNKWPKYYRDRVTLSSKAVYYPEEHLDMKGIYMQCSSASLFLLPLFPDLDKAIFLDTDQIFMRPVEDLWALFDEFNSTQLQSIAPDEDDKYPNRGTGMPYYGESGLNTGTIMMRLDRMRDMPGGWIETMMDIWNRMKDILPLPDQDIVNVYFHDHPEALYLLPCHWNYRVHLVPGLMCDKALHQGASLVHGNAGVFMGNHQMKYKKLHEAFQEFDMSTDTPQELFTAIRVKLKEVDCDMSMASSYRDKPWIDNVLLQQLQNHILGASLNDDPPSCPPTTTVIPTTVMTTTEMTITEEEPTTKKPEA